MVHEVLPEYTGRIKNEGFPKKLEKPISAFTEWIKPKDVGRFGIGFSYRDKEIFIGVTIVKAEFETIVKRKRKKIVKRGGGVRVVDL